MTIPKRIIQYLILFASSALLNIQSAQADQNTSYVQASTMPQFVRCNDETHGTAFYGAQCAQITLPQNDTAQAVTLNILRASARSTPKNDPLVVITGGPGTSAVSLAWQYLRFFSDVQKERDILFIDQRGTGKSAPFICESAGDLDPNLPEKQLAIARNKALIECAKNHPAESLRALNTPQAASDINAVRKILGYKMLNLWGSSYGTRVAMEYQKRYRQSARTVILDGVAPAAIALPRYAQYEASAALQQLFLACSQQSPCHQKFGDLSVIWQQLLNQLSVQPIQVNLTHPRTTKPVNITASAAIVANWVRFALYSQELAALLPLAITKAHEGNLEYLANLAQAASDSVSNGMSYGMHAAILCAEDNHAPALKRELISALPAMPFATLNDLTPVCDAITNQPIEPTLFDAISSHTPTLLLSGRFDPITPAFWGDWASQHMTNALHLIIDGGHHGVSGLGCVPELIAQFIAQGHFETLNTQCVETLEPAHFFINTAGPALVLEPTKNHNTQATATSEAKP